MNIHGIIYKRGNVGRIFPSNSILDPVSTPRNALYDRRTEVSKMETVNYILIWRHASWENLSRARTSDSLSFAVAKRGFVVPFICFTIVFFTYRFDYSCKIIQLDGEKKRETMIKTILNDCFSL